MVERVWSKYQLAVFEDAAKGSGSAAIEAVAGGAKSTTAIESLNHLPSKCGNVLVTSFSVQSVDDLKKKDPPWFVDIRTMNSLGNKAVTEAFGRQQIDTNRVYKILDTTLGESPSDSALRGSFNGFRVRVKALVDFAKNNLVGGTSKLMELADHYDIDPLPPEWMRDKLSDKYGCPWEEALGAAANKTLEACKQIDGKIDFNDQLWLPVVLNLPLEKYGIIVDDEAQDTSAVQVELLHRSLAKGGRVFMYGDDYQSIYHFRGAGAGMGPFIKKVNAKRLPLSISYRCPKAVVKEAQAVVPHIQSHPNAAEGFVGSIKADMLSSKLVPGDTVLSRKNAPLIALFMKCLRDGVPVGMQGKEIGKSFLRFIDDSGARFSDELIKFTDDWATAEIKRRQAKNVNANVDRVIDHRECIEALCADTSSLSVVKDRVNQLLLAPTEGRVLLSSVHRSKGLEFDKVYLIESSFPVKPSYWLNYASQKKGDVDKWCKKMAAQIIETETEERNILYVAITRSKRELIYVQ